MINQLTEYIKSLAVFFPIDIYVLVGSFVEEILTPIPSPLVLTFAGTLAASQNHTILYLLWLSALGSFGKTIVGWFFYVLADKGEDFILKKFGKYIGISHKQVESVGKYFNGTWKDDVILIVVRALPIMPTSLISVVCGFIKLDIKTYLRSTFLGYAIRSFFFLYIGYAGIETYDNVSNNLNGVQSILKIAIGAVVLVALIWWFIYKKRNGGIDEFLKKFQRRK